MLLGRHVNPPQVYAGHNFRPEIKFLFKNNSILLYKGLIYLPLRDSDKWDKTAHAKSYVADT